MILRDATSFQLPAHLSKFYEGNAGDTTGSVIKIQQEYDLLSKKIIRLDFRNGIENDVEWLNQKGLQILDIDLNLMDLGYYKFDHLKKIDQEGGYFISRYKVGTNLFVKDIEGMYQSLDWQKMLLDVTGADFEQDVCLGSGKEKLPVRLHLQKIPTEAFEKRLKKYDQKQKNGHQPLE